LSRRKGKGTRGTTMTVSVVKYPLGSKGVINTRKRAKGAERCRRTLKDFRMDPKGVILGVRT